MEIIRGPINKNFYIYVMVMTLSYYNICSTSTVSKNNPKTVRIGFSRAENVQKMALLAMCSDFFCFLCLSNILSLNPKYFNT